MLKITKITAAQAKSYYAKDDHYYAKSEMESEWVGRLAADLQLNGRVEARVFEAMLEGELPNGSVLPGKGNDRENRRAGFDATFSAPKSVSIAALVNEDVRLLKVHDQAVKTALEVAETRYAQDREWNRDTKTVEIKQTGKLAIALFQHDTSRDLDPNLHTHAVILNGTQDENGKYRALYTNELYANRKLLDDIYLNELAFGARQLGYEIEPTSDGFELAGYSRELRDTFSQRRKAIETEVAEQVESGAISSGKLYQQAALKTRSRKRDSRRESLMKDWADVLATKKMALPPAPTTAEKRDLTLSGQIQAIEAAQDGINHAEERESVFRRGIVERFALEHHLGAQSWQQLQGAIAQTHQLIPVEAVRDQCTTQTAIDRERETIALMQRGQGRSPAIADRDRRAEVASNYLTTGQRAALELGITTTDTVIAWQGSAGAGKTYALALYCQLAAEAGYVVRGFAPSAAAAAVLSEEVGAQGDTVASLLCSNPGDQPTLTPEIWIVDEAGLLSAKDCHALLKRATADNARVLLVGDTKQLSAVEAGNPFKSLQQHGIAIAHLEESLRQKKARLKAAVDAIATGDLGAGFHHLDEAGSIRAVQSQAERTSAIVKDYLALSPAQRQKTLIMANTNIERSAITQGIRQGLQVEGQLAADTFLLESLKSRDLTRSEAKYAKNYELGDVIVPTQDYRKQQLGKGRQYAVKAIHAATNRLVVENDGQTFELDPSRCDRKTVYRTEQIPIAPGDQMRWTRNDRTQNRRNGQAFTIEGLDNQGTAIVRHADGKTAFIDLSGRQFADYDVVSTTYASQGKTADRVLAALDHTTGKESFYVAASRARHEFAIYTTNADELQQLAAHSRAKENASDYLNLFTYENRHAQNQTRTTETQTRTAFATAADDSADRGIRIGSGVGGSLAAALQRDCGLEASAGDLEQSLGAFNRSDWVTGINVDAVADAVTRFVERRTICRNGAEITTALKSIVVYLQQLERISQAITERDQSSEGVEPSPSGPTPVQPEPTARAKWTEPLTLVQVSQLSEADWHQLTPRHQITLVEAAQAHQRSQPRVYTRPEQWVGQAAHLQQELETLRDRMATERETLQELESRGQRSILNPFGATHQEMYDAQDQLATTRAVCQHRQGEFAQLQSRTQQRQQEETALRDWWSDPQSQGAQRIVKLLQQPNVKSSYEAVVQTVDQLWSWQKASQQLRSGSGRHEQIRAVAQAYLDGQGLSQTIREQMQRDLKAVRAQNHQLQRQSGIEL